MAHAHSALGPACRARLRPGPPPALPGLALRSRRLLARALPPARPEAPPTTTKPSEEAFATASSRLQELLDDAASCNRDTVPIDHLDAFTPEERLTLFTNLGSLAVFAAILACFLFGDMDPLGGMRLSSGTLDAALWGAVYAAPLLACSAASRSAPFKREFPVLEEMHEAQAGIASHFTAGMNLAQRGILICFLVLPAVLLLLPATRAGIFWSGSFIQQALLQPMWGGVLHVRHVRVPALEQVLPPVLSGYLAGALACGCFGVRPKQLAVLRDALRSADAFFRLATAQAAGTRGGRAAQQQQQAPLRGRADAGPPSVFAATASLSTWEELDAPEEQQQQQEAVDGSSSTSGQEAAAAFRAVAMVWLLSKRRVARLCYVLACLDVAYLGVVWQATGNLATPMAAALLHAAAEAWLGEAASGSQQQGGKRAVAAAPRGSRR